MMKFRAFSVAHRLGICTALVAAFMAFPGSRISAAANPGVYLNKAEIDAIKAKVAAGQEPWKSAYDKMKAEADSLLSQSAQSVTFQGNTGHDYYTMKPYDWSNNMPSPCGGTRCDGYTNPEADRGDYIAAMAVSKAVRGLGLGYAFTGNTKYADKAVSLIRVWALDSATRMTPKVFLSQAIEQYVSFPGLFYGADLIWNYPGWSSTERANFAAWARAFAGDALDITYSNNWEDWRQVFVASAGAMASDSTLTNHAFSKFKSTLASHIDSAGRMSKELGRTLSLDYSIYALNAMTQVAEIARHQGVDLYGYTSSGRNLELAWDYHVPYLINPSSWPYEQYKAYNQDGVALYELAYRREAKSTYKSVITKYGRPMYEKRTMGPTTLTHSLAGGTTEPAPSEPTSSAPTAPQNLVLVASE
jgi:hypothetical protein